LQTEPADSSPVLQPPPPEGLPARIFLNEEGLRAGWRLLLYAAFWLTLAFLGRILIFQVGASKLDRFSPQSVSLGDFVDFASAYAAALLMARLERRPMGVYGLPMREAFRKSFWIGFLMGLGEISLLIALIGVFGGYSFGTLAVHGAGLFGWGILWLVAFVFVGLSEEFLFRGYAQYTLASGIGFWPAALTLSLVFGAAHWRNPGEGITGVLDVVVTGVVFAFVLRRTGNLWLAVGWHASFDFGETFLFSVPDSGYVFDHHLSNATLHGSPAWLTGGTIGPEGSVFSFLTMGLGALVICFLFPGKKDSRDQG